MKKYTYIYCIVAIVAMAATLHPAHCYANIDIFNDGIYSTQYEGTIFDEYSPQDDYQPFGSPSFESLKTDASLTGQLVKPFDECENTMIVSFSSSTKKRPGGTDTAELVPVGDSMLVVFLFMITLLAVRTTKRRIQVQKNKQCSTK